MMIRFSWRRGPELLSLLDAIAIDRHDLGLDAFDSRQIEWAIDTGLGPLFFRAVKDNPGNATSSHWPLLKAADLTARVISADLSDAMAEILDARRGREFHLTLLKGISLSEECYPEPHLRPMRDLDFLVASDALPQVDILLRRLGYEQPCESDAQTYENHHHLAPYFNAEKNVWVELHRGLFSAKKRASSVAVFRPKNILSQLRPSTFRQRDVYRLSYELEVVYLACHWAQDFKTLGGMTAMVDMIHLLKRAPVRLDWERIIDWVRGSVAASYLYLLLSYVNRYGLVTLDPAVLRELFVSQPSLGKCSLKLAHGIINRYLVQGRGFGRILSKRNIAVLWKALALPRSLLRHRRQIPVSLSPVRMRAG